MLRDMRGATNVPSPQKFRVMQLAANAVFLLVIAGSLFIYFRANPAVQVGHIVFSILCIYSCLTRKVSCNEDDITFIKTADLKK